MSSFPRNLAGLFLTLSALLIFLPCAASTGLNSPVEYVYDELGRLVGVTDTSGNSAAYTYDAVGNIVAVSRAATGQLAITEFTPNGGPPDTSVLISGSGFNTTASQNTVKFNKTAATVVSASATQIVARVPMGATTGAISVTTPAGAVASRANFTVGVATAPTITGFTPPIGVIGAQVSISGTNFSSEKFNNKLTFNGQPSTPSTASTTSITTTLPARSSSGKIGLATAYGAAVSNADFFVAPPPFVAADIQVTGRMPIGQSKTMTITGAGKKGLILFDGLAGQQVSMAFSASTLSSGAISILKPDGTVLGTTSLNTGAGFIDAMKLPSSGTYTVFINPAATSAGSLTMMLSAFTDVSSTITIGGPAVTVTTTVPGQNANLTFSGTAGQRVSMKISGVVFIGGGYMSLEIVKPDGTTLGAMPYIAAAGAFIDAQTLPVSGTYTIKLNPQSTAIGNMTVQVFNPGPDVTASVTIGGPAVTVATTVPGQNAALTFSGTAGQSVSMKISRAAFTGGSYASLTIIKPDGTALGSALYIWSSDVFIDTQALPATGIYTIKFSPRDGAIGTMSIQVFNIMHDVTASVAIDGPAVTVATTVPGQNAALTFSGTAGQSVSMKISGAAFIGGSYASLTITKPDGTALGSTSYIWSSNVFIDTQVLPATGIYTIKFSPRDGAIGSMSIQVFNIMQEVPANVRIGGPAVTVATTVPGQNASLTFSGTAGQRVSMKISGAAFVGGSYASLTIIKPDGTAWGSTLYLWSPETFIDTQALPAAGIYTIKFSPRDGAIGSMTVQIFNIVKDVTASVTIGGPAVTVATTVPGQNASLTFSGTAGQRVSMRISGVALTGGNYVDLTIDKPDGTPLTLLSYISSSGAFIDAQALPLTGTNTIRLNPQDAAIGSMTVQISPVAP